jgi:ankyrin repeat protein
MKGKEWTENELYDASHTETMIHKAAFLGHTEILQCLLDNSGAKPDLLNAQLQTPLHFAC